MRGLKKLTPKYGIILLDEKPAGFFQILETGLIKNLIHAVILDRGPLWFDGFGSNEDFEAFIYSFRQEFPRRPGRRLRFIPEIENSPEIQKILLKTGFKRQPTPGYQTSWVDLLQTEDALRANLKKRWRNALTKAEKEDVILDWDEKGAHFPWLMESYIQDKQTKGYDGPSVELMKSLAGTFIPGGDMLIGRALKNNKPIGAILLFCHGRGSTYQIGWSSNQGRQCGAHYLLLWDALKQLKLRDIQSFDLGGMNDDTAKGVKKFKEGLGGSHITLPGLYT